MVKNLHTVSKCMESLIIPFGHLASTMLLLLHSVLKIYVSVVVQQEYNITAKVHIGYCHENEQFDWVWYLQIGFIILART